MKKMEEKNNKQHREDICPGKKNQLDLKTARAQIADTKGPEYWRSLEELAGSSEFHEMMHREFPKGASEWLDAVSRRGFLKLMGASLAMAGMTACTKQPLQPIVPYVRQPEDVVPGLPMFYATAFTLGGYASPILVESNLYRPTKIEGNDQHPASLGGTDIFAQASILGMYDPDRSQTIAYLGDVRTWGNFLEAIRGPLNAQKAVQGAGIRILTPTVSSPALADQLRSVVKLYPQAKWHVYEPVNRDNVLEGAKMAFGQAVETQYKLENADVIVSLDADFLYAGFPGSTRYIRDFAKRRNPDAGNMSRLYVVESTMSSTGAKADHRLPARASDIEAIARALPGIEAMNSNVGGLDAEQTLLLAAAYKDLAAHRGSSVVIPGDHQLPAVHALAHAINAKLGNIGKTVFYTDPIDANPINQTDSIKDLVADMRAGKVDMLFILGGNPAYDAPADLGFADALKNTDIPVRVHLGLYQDETAELCQWHVNEAHYLESWGDARAYDGTASIVQPLIAPLYDGKSAYELLAVGRRSPSHRTRSRSALLEEAAPGSRLRCLLAEIATRWMDRRNHVHPEVGQLKICDVAPLFGQRRKIYRDQLPTRSFGLRRQLLQQRLAARTAQADVEVNLGQPRANQPGDGIPTGTEDRRLGHARIKRKDVDRARLDSSWSS
jgi:MoCo/4Fe-4S cofactor protein with predicted Tat translocation signal